ncbi:hypothetical protein JCM3765_000240 [Sporobolomyces pararoseus]
MAHPSHSAHPFTGREGNLSLSDTEIASARDCYDDIVEIFRPYWTQQAEYERDNDLDNASSGVIALYKSHAIQSCRERGFDSAFAGGVWDFNIDRETSGTYPEYLQWCHTALDRARARRRP